MLTRYFLYCSVLLLSASPVAAERGRILVGLGIASQSLDLDFDNVARKTRFDTIDLYWYEQLAPVIEGGIVLGYQELTQTDHPLPAGQTLTGEYLGLTLRINLLEGSRFRLFSDLTYRYAQATGSLSGQDIDWQWHLGTLELAGELQLGQSLAVTGGVGGQRISGRERTAGTVTGVNRFTSSESAYARGGLKLLLDPSSHIGIEGSAGAVKGGRLYFQRYF